MDAIVLYRGDQPLKEFAVGDAGLEVGHAPGCDVVVYDPEVGPRHLVVRREGGTVRVYQRGGERKGSHLPFERRWLLGRHHALVRVARPRSSPNPRGEQTDALTCRPADFARLAILVGRGPDARRVALRQRPIWVGSAPGCDLCLVDRAVSDHHCRVDPMPTGVRVWDLGSRNGTWVNGIRVTVAHLTPGARLRVGRTDLSLGSAEGTDVACGAGSSAHTMIAESPTMLTVATEAEAFADLGWPVLVQGESGSGKEVIAQFIHERSRRAHRPFVAINCGGLSPTLAASELFGHEKGAFTGAASVHRGVFEQAEGGTLFLDEVAELPLEMQAQLLRVLETWEIRRVGSEAARKVDVRLVCATHRDLRTAVQVGRFRPDLYYRIARLMLEVPPLRRRAADLAELAPALLRRFERDVGARELSDAARARLMAYDWPGNVRELKNVLSFAALMCPSRVIRTADIEAALDRVGRSDRAPTSPARLADVVDQYAGNISAAARALGMPRSTLRDRLRSGTSG